MTRPVYIPPTQGVCVWGSRTASEARLTYQTVDNNRSGNAHDSTHRHTPLYGGYIKNNVQTTQPTNRVDKTYTNPVRVGGMAELTVFRAAGGSSKSSVIHADRDCPRLRRTERIQSKPISVFPDWFDRCEMCWGDDYGEFGFTTKEGRKMIYRPDHYLSNGSGYVPEHRLVADENTDRDLDHTDIVHHIDGDVTNNDWENLQIVTPSEHARIHNKEGR